MEEGYEDDFGYQDGDVAQPEDMAKINEWDRDNFSHTICVTLAYHAAIRAGCVEMVKGFWEIKRDKFGNELRSYHPDTRLTYINAVETLKNVLVSNFDEDAAKRMSILYQQLARAKEQFTNAEKNWFMKLPYNQRNKTPYIEGHLNQDGMFYHQFVSYQVELYRRIFEELELLLKRTKYLKKKVFTNTSLIRYEDYVAMEEEKKKEEKQKENDSNSKPTN